MNEQAVAIYFICDEVTRCLGCHDDPQCIMSTAEVMTFALLSARFFGADYRLTRLISNQHGYFKKILSHSRLVRRVHQVPEAAWLLVFQVLQMYLRRSDCKYFVVDSFPVKAYENHKSFRARIFSGKDYHGYSAVKKQFFFGVKVHMIIDEDGIPIEFCFCPGSVSDIKGLQNLPCELPKGSILIGDKAYTSYELEDDLLKMAEIALRPIRKKCHKRQHGRTAEYINSTIRNRIETVFSSIVARMPRHIRARTEKGFYLKQLFFILVYLFHLSSGHE